MTDQNVDNIRIGVFVCDCGSNIAGVIDVPVLVEFASSLDQVVFAEEGKWICAVDYLSKIKEHINEHNLNRVVVACCTPRTHEPTFKATLKEAGLNPFLLEFVSIREQSSWVHQDDPILATETAKDLIRMGVAKARYLEPGEEIKIPVGRECLVIGGGIAGMTAALALADLGFEVYLVEREKELGGTLKKLNIISPNDIPADDFIEPRIARVISHDNIEVFTETEVSGITGYVGNFTVTLNNLSKSEDASQNYNVSTIIVATGMRELEPKGLFGYSKHPNIITQVELEELLKNKDKKLLEFRDIAFINCVNSRNREHGCCNVGCLSTIKNIKSLKQLNPEVNIYQFFRDFNITGIDVQYHYNAMGDYSAAFRYPDEKPPEVSIVNPEDSNGKLQIKSYDILSGNELDLSVGLLVLTPGYIGDPGNEKLKGLLKVSTNPEGFFSEAHVKLRPLDFANEGIFICGCARSPKGVHETMEESLGAAMRAIIPMQRSFVETEGIVANVDPEACLSCGICTEACAFGATELIDHETNIIKAICKGCGTCVSSCPVEAIDIIHYTDEQIIAQVDAALFSEPENKILVFACHWCALGAVDNAGVSRFQYTANLRIIRVMCSGRVDPKFILRAFRNGVRGVLVAGCEIPTCHYISGNFYAEKKVMLARKLLEFAGIKPGRLRLEWMSAAQGARFAQVATEFDSELSELGTLSNDGYQNLDLQAALKCTTSPRLRIIASKLKDFVEDGNRYSEIFTDHEIDRLIQETVYDEFLMERIKLNLEKGPCSAQQLSTELNIPVKRVFRSLVTLREFSQISIENQKDQDQEPLYKLKPETVDGTIQSEIEKRVEFPKNSIGPDENFDYLINGTNFEALSKALELANIGSRVLLLSSQSSLKPEPWLLSDSFEDYSDFHQNYIELINKIYPAQNITILCNTVITIKDELDTGFKFKLQKRPTFVDEDKCDNCGKCFEVCPVNILDFDKAGLSVKHAIYRPEPKSDAVKYAISKLVPYCQANCAIGMDVRGYIGKISDGDLTGALEIIRRTNPLPDVCGKVCDHHCELTCARGYKDEALEIRRLKRYAIEMEYDRLLAHDRAILSKLSRPINTDPENKVAIIGSGPTGLAAAYILATLGFPVTIFESEPVAGGMLRLGIPDYRLPPGALQHEIDAITNLGVELKLNTRIGHDIKFSELKNQGYKTIFIGVGAQRSLNLGIDGEDLTGVISGLEFLKKVNLRQVVDQPIPNTDIGKNVVVIGGGNVAIDCARTARRLGAEKVTILYRRTKAEMPAAKMGEELEECTAEGIELQYLVAPQKIIARNDGSGKVTAIQCVRTELGMPDPSGRRRPVIIEGSEFNLDVDCVLVAIGQLPDLEFLSGSDSFELTTRSTFIVDPLTGKTNVDGVYSGGDVVSGPANVVGAISWGQKAAWAIADYLIGDSNKSLIKPQKNTGECRTNELELLRLRKNQLKQNTSIEPENYREPRKLLEVVSRITGFDEVESLLSSPEASTEAKRCLSCRACIGCGVCQMVCPENAIDYTMTDEYFNVTTREILEYPKLVEGRFNDRYDLKELYKNNLDVITIMELEYMLKPDSVYSGQPLRPSDGKRVKKLGFLYLPELEFINEMDKQLNELELKYIFHTISLIHKKYPEIVINCITNHDLQTKLNEQFDQKAVEDKLIILDPEDQKISVDNSKNELEIIINGQQNLFDMLVISSGLRFEE